MEARSVPEFLQGMKTLWTTDRRISGGGGDRTAGSHVLEHFFQHMPRSKVDCSGPDPQDAHQCAPFVLASESMNSLAVCIFHDFFHRDSLSRLNQSSGSTDFLVVYVLLCVRFGRIVQHFCLLYRRGP